MKECFNCKITLPLSGFYKSKTMTDGHLNKCKECIKSRVRENYRENINYYKEYEKNRAMLPHRIKLREEYSKTNAYKISQTKTIKKQRQESPKKYKARNFVNNALRAGFLIKPQHCEECLLDKKLHGHHCDYNKPLDVMWLCTSCHREWHKNNEAIT